MIKCLVKHCQNHVHEGPGRMIHHAQTYASEPVQSDFICAACWSSLTRGVEADSVNLNNMVLRLIGPDRYEEARRRKRESEEIAARLEKSARKITNLATDAAKCLGGASS